MIGKKGVDLVFSPKTLRWLLRVGKLPHLQARLLAGAVSGGNVNEYYGPYRRLLLTEIVEYIVQTGGDEMGYTVYAIEHAIYKGDLDLVKRLSKLNKVVGPLYFDTPNPDYRTHPFIESNTACLEWAYRKYGITNSALRVIAATSSLGSISKWARSRFA